MEHDTKTEKKSKRTGTPPNSFTHLLTTAPMESSFAEMRDALDYVRVRLGSVYLGESLHKIDQALSVSTAFSSTASGGNTGVSEGVDEFTKWRQQMSKKG